MSSMNDRPSAEDFSSTKTPQLTASLSLLTSPLPSMSSMSDRLSAEDFSSSTKTPQLTASLSLLTSPLPSMSSMNDGLHVSAEDFSSSTKTPQLTSSLSLHASPLSPMSSLTSGLSAEDFSSSTKTPQLTALPSLHASPLPAFSTAIASYSSKSLQLMSQTEPYQPSSRRLLAVTTATVAMTTSSTYPTLDQSFSTNLYWLKVDVTISEDVDVKERGFITAMETSIARAYSEGKARKDERATAVQDLLEKLNPDNDPLLSVRRKRAVTIDGNTAQVIDLSRDVNYPTNVVLVFYIAEGDTSIPAGESKAIFSELTLQEMTFYLQVVVKSYPTEFLEVVVVATTSPPDLTPLWIVLGVFGGLALLCTGCCCCFVLCRICCRPRPKSARDGPMDMDTLKMLQHKQKYPYRPYKTPNQTPRGFDVAKETGSTKDGGVAKEPSGSGSGFRLQSSGTGSILKKQFNAVNTARLDVDAYSSSSSSELSLHGNDLTVPPLELNSVNERTFKKTTLVNEEDAFHQAASSLELNASGRSHLSNGRLLPLRPQKGHSGDDWNLKSGRSTGRSSSRDSPRSLSTSREAEELKRIYREAQREISRVLEPDIIPDQSDRTYVAPDRQPKSRGKASKRGRKTEVQETAFGRLPSDPALPDAHSAKRATKKQTSGQKRPEALQEARRRVHNLIDEAFSLVGLPKNAISPVIPLATNAPPIATDQEERTNNTKDNQTLFQRKISESVTSSAADIKGREFGSSPAEIGRSHHGKDADEKTTRVVLVPVSHQADAAANIVWNPYSAEDEWAQLHQSQQLTSVPGGVEDTHHPHQAAHHLTMPHPVSIPETSREQRIKGLTSSQQTDNEKKRVTSQGKLSNSQEDLMQGRPSTSMRRSSTSSRRLSTDSDIPKLRNTAPDDPYLDPYLKSSLNDELIGTYTLSPRSDDPTAPQEDPYAMALLRSDREPQSPKPDSGRGDMLSTLSKERGVGKPVADGYDEFDVSRDVAGRDKSGQLVAAIRDELVRLAKKSGQHGSGV
ncbi:uncharacterized protein LOC119724005 isoform X1 [Patiria miniata]|uniref:Uncharacterized protein n=1 Tax=Patiria miniata TaxID=46514 RepID=A0A913ZGD3_PATMI|nr:uncharacterized protein LOC119724005 isoform X1 [Patiria miniata]